MIAPVREDARTTGKPAEQRDSALFNLLFRAF